MWKTKDIYGDIDPLSTSLNLYDKFQFIWQKKNRQNTLKKQNLSFQNFNI